MSALVKALAALVAMAAVAELAAAKNHTIQWSVGGNYGDMSVSVGDTVVFSYSSAHTVNELSPADYKACSFDNALSSDKSGTTAFTFDKAGTRYFACATGSHCTQGQKVSITVGSGSTSSPSPPKPSGSSASSSMAGAGELAVKLVLGLGVGGALLAAF